jgi:hypothetical protein
MGQLSFPRRTRVGSEWLGVRVPGRVEGLGFDHKLRELHLRLDLGGGQVSARLAVRATHEALCVGLTTQRTRIIKLTQIHRTSDDFLHKTPKPTS